MIKIMTRRGQLNVEETGINPAQDVARLHSGQITKDGLLRLCLAGADADRVPGWHDYVDAVVMEADRLKERVRIVRGSDTRQVDNSGGALSKPADPAKYYYEPRGYDGDVLWSEGFDTYAQALQDASDEIDNAAVEVAERSF